MIQSQSISLISLLHNMQMIWIPSTHHDLFDLMASLSGPLNWMCNKPAGNVRLTSQRTTNIVGLMRCTIGAIDLASRHHFHNVVFSLSLIRSDFSTFSSILSAVAVFSVNSTEFFTCLQLMFRSLESYLQVSMKL